MIFDPHINISNIVLVGCGGTGAQWARSIARIVYDMKQRNLHAPTITFVDPDTVEAKNVGRQLFAPGDIGMNKAEVLARRFSLALGLDIRWIPNPFDPESIVSYGTVLCGAVDNHEARRAMARYDCLWIDAGNHRDAGQVIIGNVSHARHWKGMGQDEDTCRYLPTAALLFPQLLEPEPEPAPTLSCAELVALNEQHLLCNDMVANIASQYLWKLLNRQPITTFMTYVDADGMNMRSVPISRAEIEARLPQEEMA